jgi:hypothetical protein
MAQNLRQTKLWCDEEKHYGAARMMNLFMQFSGWVFVICGCTHKKYGKPLCFYYYLVLGKMTVRFNRLIYANLKRIPCKHLRFFVLDFAYIPLEILI